MPKVGAGGLVAGGCSMHEERCRLWDSIHSLAHDEPALPLFVHFQRFAAVALEIVRLINLLKADAGLLAVKGDLHLADPH